MGIVLFFDLVIGHHVSKGTIHTIRKNTAEAAKAFDAGISLEAVQEIASDEIFQHNKPVLTVIDLETGYIPIIEATEDRSGETWQRVLEAKKEQGFCPSLNVSDQGSGLCKGIPKAFPGIVMQPDVFHLLRDLGREVHTAERAGFAELRKIQKLEKQVFGRDGIKSSFALYHKYNEAEKNIDVTLRQIDALNILFEWLREHMGYTGYSYGQSIQICEWILDEMSKNLPQRTKLQKAISNFRSQLPTILSFLHRLQTMMAQKATDFHVSMQDFMLLYHQQFYPANSRENEQAEMRLYHKFGRNLAEARSVLQKMVKSARRASSMIENLNGRIRCFMDLKRDVPKQFLLLIKVFFNTKKALRPHNKDWEGTSALERLTGEKYPEFLDLLVAPMDYVF